MSLVMMINKIRRDGDKHCGGYSKPKNPAFNTNNSNLEEILERYSLPFLEEKDFFYDSESSNERKEGIDKYSDEEIDEEDVEKNVAMQRTRQKCNKKNCTSTFNSSSLSSISSIISTFLSYNLKPTCFIPALIEIYYLYIHASVMDLLQPRMLPPPSLKHQCEYLEEKRYEFILSYELYILILI
jgi:hypothetical protein